jgi:hypothetical protein
MLSDQCGRWHGGKSIVLVIDQIGNFSMSEEVGIKYGQIFRSK